MKGSFPGQKFHIFVCRISQCSDPHLRSWQRAVYRRGLFFPECHLRRKQYDGLYRHKHQNSKFHHFPRHLSELSKVLCCSQLEPHCIQLTPGMCMPRRTSQSQVIINIYLQAVMGNSPNWEQIRTRTIHERNDKINKFLPIFRDIIKHNNVSPDRVQKITRMDLPELVEQLNSGKVTSQLLVAIFGERAGTIGVKNCIITDQIFEYALNRARECDQERKRSQKRNWTMNDQWDMEKHFPPLFGIPTSVKDNIQIEGTHSTIGATIRAQRIDKEDCATIKTFKRTGLIPFMKTNLPQLAFNFDSFNFLWGRTLNPWNHKKSAGGSSGGQGAAIASRVSPIGIGNDMAGSIRIPAAFNGVFGLLCSADRLPFWNQMVKYSTGFTGMDTVMAVNGPLAKSCDSLALWMKHMVDESIWKGQHDAYKKLFPFDIKTYQQYAEGNRKLKIGYIQSLEIIEPTPAVRRGVVETVDFLKKQGHEVKQVAIPNENELVYSLFTELLCEGNFQSFAQILEGQPLVQQYHQMSFMASRNNCILSCLQCLIDSKYPRLGKSVKAMKKRGVHEYLEHVGRIHELQQQFIKYWRKQELDFIVLPGFATEAATHGSSKQGSFLATYTYLFNILRMTSVSQPVAVTQENQLHYESDWEDPCTQLIRENIKDAQGMPVSIQVVALPFQEEKVLGISKKIEKHFRFYEKHPLPSSP